MDVSSSKRSPLPVHPERLTYRLAELVTMTGVARQTLHDRCYTGALDCRKDGRNVLVTAASVTAWIDAMRPVSG